MSQFTRVRWCFLLIVLLAGPVFATNQINHDLVVTLNPDSGELQLEDTISLSEPSSKVGFNLHANLKVEVLTPGAKIIRNKKVRARTTIPLRHYRIKLPEKHSTVKVAISGKIQHKLKDYSSDYSGGRITTPGIISPQGVFLSVSSYWFPVLSNDPVSFSLKVNLPDGWSSISQGKLQGHNQWIETAPQDDIYLIAGQFKKYKRLTEIAEAQVFLRQEDDALAERYLQATEHYLKLYSDLLGPYPYNKFTLVENFWESGYGMPSFTLLGPRVIRFPFIIHTSYPHEILHNWWGNGVFVDYSSGNWSEGLTSYLADHMLREQRGKGSAYRRDTLKNYADYVSDNKDFPLKKFRGRHGQASQAVGYGKTMMFLHMIRMELGDQIFLNGLRKFYKDNLYHSASFSDLQTAFEEVSGKDLKADFKQWVERSGAPALTVSEHDVEETEEGKFKLSFVIRQNQRQKPFRLKVPVYIQIADVEDPIHRMVELKNRETRIEIETDNRPLAINVDPQFNVFRKLDQGEIPSSLAQLFSSNNSMVVLPSEATPEMRDAYEQLADSWKKRARRMIVVWDDKIKSIPSNRSVWLLGKENLFAFEFLGSTKGLPMSLEVGTLSVSGREYSLGNHSMVLTSRQPHTIGWLHAFTPEIVATLARKIPHYGKYSYLAFDGKKVKNVLKGQWPTVSSEMQYRLDRSAPPLSLPELAPLSELIK